MDFERYETRPGLTLNRIKEIVWETIKTFGEERLPLWTRNRYGIIPDRIFTIGDNSNMEIKCIKGSGTELDTHVRIVGSSYDTKFGMGVCIYVNCSGIPFIKITEKYIIHRPDRLGRMLGDKDYKPGSWLVGDTLKDFVSLIIGTFEKEDKAIYTYRFEQDNVFDSVDIFSTVSKVLETFLNDKIDNLRLSNNVTVKNNPSTKLWYVYAKRNETQRTIFFIEFSQYDLHNIKKHTIYVDALQPIITIDESGVHCNLEEVTTQRTLTKSEMLKLAEKIRDELDVAAAFNSVKQSLAKESTCKKHASELMKQFGILTRAQIADIAATQSKIQAKPNDYWCSLKSDMLVSGTLEDNFSPIPATYSFSINPGKIFIDKGDFTMKIKEVTYSGRATIVFWTDGTKTVVKTAEGETFSKDVGLAMAIAEKYFGSYSAMKSYIKRNTKDANEANAKKKNKKD